MSYYSVKTTASHEQSVVEMVVEKGGDGVVAGMAPENMRGYVLFEADDPNTIERVLSEVPHAQKILSGEASATEVLGFLEPASDVENISVNDLVEIRDGPYHGQMATVTKVHDGKGRVTVTLKEATVQIPVEMKGSQVKRLDSEDRDT